MRPFPGEDETSSEVGKTPFGWGGAFGNGLVPLYGGRFPLETDGALFGADGTFFKVARASFWSSLVPESEGLCGRLGLVWGRWDRVGLSGRLAILIELNKCRLGRWPRCVLGWKA